MLFYSLSQLVLNFFVNVFLELGSQNQDAAFQLWSSVLGRVTCLSLLAVLLFLQPKVLLTFFAVFSSLSVRTPKSFSAELFSCLPIWVSTHPD